MWQPRLEAGQPMPTTIEEWYRLATSPLYQDSGIQGHLPYLRQLVEWQRSQGIAPVVVELGTGGMDQSTIAWIAGGVKYYEGYDLNVPNSLDTIARLAQSNGVGFSFHNDDTANAPVLPSTILFIDSLHNLETVEIELARFAPLCSGLIVFHDVCAFGRVGQSSGPNTGINLAIAEFLFNNTEWSVVDYRQNDNGLLTLQRKVE